MDISVIVVSWNALEYLERFVLGERRGMPYTYSLQALEEPPSHEVILVDNASTDGSAELCRNLAGGYQKFRALLLHENVGYARALNLGLMKAKGDILISCNPDLEIMAPDLLEWVEKGLRRMPKSILGPELVFGSGKGPNDSNVLYLQGHFIAFRREFLDDAGFWHEGFGAGGYEDLELSVRAQRYGYRLQSDRGIPIWHAVARSTVYGNNPDFNQEEFNELQKKNRQLFHRIMSDEPVRYIPA